MALFYTHKSRGLTRDVQVDGPDGAITLTSDDKLRAIIQAVGTAYLTVTSDAATANGSSFTKGSPSATLNRLRLDASDLATLAKGVYTLVIDMFDAADASEWKNVDRQILYVEE